MPLDPIQRRPIADPGRAAYQEQVARAVETDPEPFLALYRAEPRTHGGRYVAADMMKEVFPEFSASREGRTRFNLPLHNSAAVLANEQFRRAVADASQPERDTVIFLTGIPGAGKTSAVLDNGRLPDHVRAVYEGQLARPEAALPKVQAALDAGLKVQIVAIHVQPEVALVNTFGRHEREGRGAGVEAMASVQGHLAAGLAAIHERFGDRVDLAIIDRRAGMNASQALEGWDKLTELESEGTYAQINARIHAAIDRHEAEGIVSPGAIREARGLPPLSPPELGQERGIDDKEPVVGPLKPSGPSQAVPTVPDQAAAEAAQARGLEADQARLQSGQGSSAGEGYNAALQTYLTANAERIERIESRLETLIENQRAEISEREAHPPGFFASRQARAEWAAGLESAQDRLQTLIGHLSRVEDLEERTGELAEERLRRREPELTKARDAEKQTERTFQEQRRRARTPERQGEREPGRVLSLGEE